MSGVTVMGREDGGVRYCVLGTTRALLADGTPVQVGGARLRALLTVLALRPGRSVPVAVLVDEVWAGEPPADTAGAVQALVGRLRRAIGAARLVSADGGYRLCAERDDVDVYRFERLAAEGTRALAGGDARKAAAALDDALALWHGPVLADLPDRGTEATRWEARRADARRARLEAALALGAAEEALPELTALCDAHPLQEPLQVLRLRALRDAGRTAEALAAYEDVRRALSSRLGTDPGRELREIHAELLRQPGPAVSGASGGPGAGDAPGGAGGSFPATPATPAAGAPSGAGGAGRPVTAAHPPPVPGNLRARLTSFVGREDDLGELGRQLGHARLVTLLGPGGAGKTRLSQEAAEAFAAHVPDGVWLAELAPVAPGDSAAVPEAVVTALGARETVLRGAGAEELRAVAERPGDDPLVRLVEHCAPRRMLLVLDNCEHVVDAVAPLAARLLERCPGLTVLATSRAPLGVPGEVLHPVEPLPEPVAVRLLAERGAAARPGFRTDVDPEAVAEICRRLDGLPLAIELAAARLRVLTPRQIADRLDDRFRLLTSGVRTVLPRQQTLRAVVDWSWELLDDAERAVLRRLAVFAGGCDLAAAEAVCGALGGDVCEVLGVLDVLDILGSLVDKSLVVAAPAAPDGDGMRYRLLETVAEYAAERLDEAGDRAAAERAHLVHYRELARTTDARLRGPEQPAALTVLTADQENLRAALRSAVALGDEQEALCLALSLCWYWQVRDLRHEANSWAKAVGALGPDPFTEPVEPAPPLVARCTDAPPPMSPEMLQEARRGVHLMQVACMDMEAEQWRTPEARAKLHAISRTYRPGLPQTCRVPGNLWVFAVILTGDLTGLRDILQQSVHTCRELGYEWELAMFLQLRANLLANRGDLAGEAMRDADESLALFTALGDTWGTAEALSARAEARERVGEYAAAAADYRGAIVHTERLGARSQKAILTVRLAGALAEQGEEQRAEEMLREVVDGTHGVWREALPAGRLFLAVLLGRTGRVAESREQLLLAREKWPATGFAVFDGFVSSIEVWLLLVEGRHEEGLALVRRAMEKGAEALVRAIAPEMAAIHLALAALAYASHGTDDSARTAGLLLGAAGAQLPAGHVPNAMEREITGRTEATVRAVLDDAVFAAVRREGGGLSLEEATALV